MFPFAKLQIEIELLDDNAPREFWGARLRGGYGYALKERFCTHWEHERCRSCARFAQRNCAYPDLFEPTRRPSDIVKREAPLRGDDLPRPFVIDAPFVPEHELRRGARLRFGLTLLGRAMCEQSQVAMDALVKFGQGEITTGHFQIVDVCDELAGGGSLWQAGQSAAPMVRDIAAFAEETNVVQQGKALTLEFITPTAIEYDKARRKDEKTGLAILSDCYDLVYFLTLRVGGLWQHYGENWRGQAEFFRWHNALLKAAKMVQARTSDLQPAPTIFHYAMKRDRLEPLDGFVGKLELIGAVEPLAQLLRIGEIVHLGAQTDYGLGRYRLTA